MDPPGGFKQGHSSPDHHHCDYARAALRPSPQHSTDISPEGLRYFSSSREMSILSCPICGAVNKIPHYNFTVIPPALVRKNPNWPQAPAPTPESRPGASPGQRTEACQTLFMQTTSSGTEAHKALCSSSARVEVPACH